MSVDPYTIPAMTAPAGIESNFIDPPSQIVGVIVGSTCILAIVTLLVFLRIFTKARIVQELHIEDYLSVLAWALLVCFSAIIIYLEAIGFAREQWDVNIVMMSDMTYWLNVVFILYGPTTAAAKLSVLFQIKRIFTTTRKTAFFWIVWVSIILNGCFYLSVLFFFIFECWPREAIWNSSVSGQCINELAGGVATGLGNVLSDLQALLLPAWAIWHLKTKIKTKLSIFAVFAVGSVALAIGGAGLWIRIVFTSDPNQTWFGTQLTMLSIAEIGIVIIIGCMPVYPRLYNWLKQRADGVSPEQTYQPDELYSGNRTPSALRRGRRTGKSDLDIDILVTHTQEFAHSPMDSGLELAEYKAHIYNGNSTS